MSRIKIEITPEMKDREPREVLLIAADQIEAGLRAAFVIAHGQPGLAMLDDALNVMKEAHKGGPQ